MAMNELERFLSSWNHEAHNMRSCFLESSRTYWE